MTTGPDGGAKKPNWTKQEESKIRRIFKQCDADGNGSGGRDYIEFANANLNFLLESFGTAIENTK